MVVKTMKESDFEQFCEMVPQLVSDVSKMMSYRNKVYRSVTEDDKMMEKTVSVLKELKMAIRNRSKQYFLVKMTFLGKMHLERQRVYRGEPLLIAIIFMIGTKYDCNIHNKEDEIWLQCWSK